jgi:hypothetical protein
MRNWTAMRRNDDDDDDNDDDEVGTSGMKQVEMLHSLPPSWTWLHSAIQLRHRLPAQSAEWGPGKTGLEWIGLE